MTGEDVLLPEGPSAARAARTEVRRLLEPTVAPDDVDTVLLLVSELVTNAALHVGGPVRLRLRATGPALRIEVRDSSPRLPVRRRALDHERVSGRGTHLVDLLSRRAGADVEDGGKVVWCELDVVCTAPAG